MLETLVSRRTYTHPSVRGAQGRGKAGLGGRLFGILVICAGLPLTASTGVEVRRDLPLYDFAPPFNINSIPAGDLAPGVALAVKGGPGQPYALGVQFPAGYLQHVTLRPTSGAWNLSDYVFVAMDVTNRGTRHAQVLAALNLNERCNGAVVLAPQETKTLKVLLWREKGNLNPFTNSLLLNTFFGSYVDEKVNFSIQAKGLPGGFYIGFNSATDKVVPEDIRCLSVYTLGSETHQVEIANVRATGRYAPPTNEEVLAARPFIDVHGQFDKREWEGKTHSVDELRQAYVSEQAELAAFPPSPKVNAYGGWTGRGSVQMMGNGRFRVEKYNGKWTLVDPDGRLFWSTGITCVGSGDSTMVQWGTDPAKWIQRRACFRDLDKVGVYSSNNWDYRVNHFVNNLKWKYGEDASGTNWGSRAADHLQKRLRSWGINTLAAWSDIEVSLATRTPFTVVLQGMFTQGLYPKDDHGLFYAALNYNIKEEIARVEARLQRAAEEAGDDSLLGLCLGYFVNNEIWWGWDLKDLPADNPRWGEFRQALDKFYGTCRNAIQSYYAEKDETPRLYLGSRLHLYSAQQSRQKRLELEVSAKYCDVISLNRYTYQLRDMDTLMRGEDGVTKLDKPVLIGEFHFGALDLGMDCPGFRYTASQQERGEAYYAYVCDALTDPSLVGVHWFQYADEPYTARGDGSDGDNGQIGFVDICDRPYPALVDAARKAGRNLYDIRWRNVSPW